MGTVGAILGPAVLVCVIWGAILLGYAKISQGVGSLDPVPRSDEQRRAQGRAAGVALRLPASGSYPLHLAAWLAALSGHLFALGLETTPLVDFAAPFTWAPVQVVVVFFAAGALGWLFHRPARMFEAARELGVDRVHTRRRLRKSARRAVWSSAVLLAVLAFLTHWLGAEQRGVDVLGLGLIVAVVLDVSAEVRVTLADALTGALTGARPSDGAGAALCFA